MNRMMVTVENIYDAIVKRKGDIGIVLTPTGFRAINENRMKDHYLLDQWFLGVYNKSIGRRKLLRQVREDLQCMKDEGIL